MYDLKCVNCGDNAVLQVFKGIVYARIDHEGVMEDIHTDGAESFMFCEGCTDALIQGVA